MSKFLLAFCFFFALQNAGAQTFSSTVNQLIPDDNSVIMFDINVSGMPDVIDTIFGLKQVCINLTHTYDEDMQVLLRAPDGKIIQLFGGVGGGDDNFTNTCVAGVGMPFSSGSAPYTGTFLSYGILGNINNGQNPNGTWTLICYDTYAGADQGFLIDWNISFGTNPAKPFVFESSDLPIVKLTTLDMPIVDNPKVPVLMQIIDNGPGIRNESNQTNYAYEGRIMAEWQGFTGPYYPKKNYDFKLIDSLGNDLDTTILGQPKEHDWIFKAEYLDHTLIKNSVTYEMARRMGRYAPRTSACEIVLDGEYAGIYFLTEKVKRDKHRVDIAKLTETDTMGSALTGGYIIEMNITGDQPDWTSNYLPINYATSQQNVEFKHVYPKRDAILPEQHDYIHHYVDSFENALVAPNFADPAAGYRNFVDVSTFIDFLIVNEFSVNYDSYGRSTYLYKEKDTAGGKLKIGPPWDYDRALDYDNPGTLQGWVWEVTHAYWPFPFWWSRMWEDDAYRQQLACRWSNLRQSTFRTDSFMVLIDSTAGRLAEAQHRNFRIWNDLGNRTYEEHIGALKSYITQRLDWIDANLPPAQPGDPDFSSQQTGGAGPVWTFVPNNLLAQSYHWDFGDGDTSNLMSPVHNYTAAGTYVVALTVADGCFTQTSVQTIQFNFVGTVEQTAFPGKLFPNPFQENILLNLASPAVAPFMLSLENELGQTFLSKQYAAGTQSGTFPTAGINPGVYILRIRMPDHVWKEKLIRM